MGIYTKIIDLQKLNQAWDKVKSNRPAAGADGVTVDMFDASKREYLMQLNSELKAEKYKAGPVKIIEMNKGEKLRNIALFSMRDKVVHQAINLELSKFYEPLFSDACCAYRPGRSALQALERVENVIKAKQKSFVLKTDIKGFFDNINHDMLIKTLEEKITEHEAIRLIISCIQTPYIDENGEIKSNKKGLYQGASISPVLSNIYLRKLDNVMAENDIIYLRYSDDILMISDEKFRLEDMLKKLKEELSLLSLDVNADKTSLVSVKEGFIYLGYMFDDSGKYVPYKAEKELQERLENIWFEFDGDIAARISKGREVLSGWSQYYNKDDKINSIYEYIIRIDDYAQKNNDLNIFAQFIERRFDFVNYHKDILRYMDELWKKIDRPDLCLKEYEQFYSVLDVDCNKFDYNNNVNVKTLIDLMRKLSINETEDILTEIIQIYTDYHCYQRASKLNERRQQLSEYNETAVRIEDVNTANAGEMIKDIFLHEEDVQKYMELFVCREDCYCVDAMAENNKRRFEQVNNPLTPDIVKSHIKGDICAATFIQRINSTVHFMMIDVDVSKKILLQYSYKSEMFNQYIIKARSTVVKIGKILKKFGLNYIVEDSGYRGYHIWVFFSEWVQTRYVNMLQDVIDAAYTAETEDEITIEHFPNKTRVKADKAGQAIKMPWGYNLKTGRRCIFLNEDFTPISRQIEVLSKIKKTTLSELKRIISLNSNNKVKEQKTSLSDIDISSYGRLDDTVALVLEQCGLVRYLCAKAKNTGYLTHQERLTIVYIFGHLGDAGKSFVHKVMENTLNYQYTVTEKFIRKLPEKPISCVKLREQYTQLTAEIGCNCNFKRTKNCYPSPVLHALREGLDDSTDVTIPTSRDVSKEKQKQVYDEINIHKKTQELANKLLQLRKQKRGIDRTIIKFENELSEIFDSNNTECMEIEMGLLVRRKRDNGYEWVIEI